MSDFSCTICDANDTKVTLHHKDYVSNDTTGLRHKGTVERGRALKCYPYSSDCRACSVVVV